MVKIVLVSHFAITLIWNVIFIISYFREDFLIFEFLLREMVHLARTSQMFFQTLWFYHMADIDFEADQIQRGVKVKSFFSINSDSNS